MPEDVLKRLSRNKESVRTTFKLSEEAINMLDGLSKNRTVKGFFDDICLPLLEMGLLDLTGLTDENQKAEFSEIEPKIRKTYAISQSALALLTKSAKQQQNVSRDAFVEHLIRSVNKFLNALKEERIKKHTKALEIVNRKWNELETAHKELKNLLGDEDPIYIRFNYATIMLMNLSLAIDKELKDGIPIDPDDFSQS